MSRNYTLTELDSRKGLKEFIRFPLDLYKDCPQYVPALNADQKKSLTSCSTLSYCKRKMWLLKDGKRTVGRICAMINPRYNELYGAKRARFGWFDVIDDFEAASMLIGAAEKWAAENGMEEVHGPLYYNTLGKQGMLVEGFENTPPFNCLYNFPYYVDFIERLGYVKECDWVQYRITVPEALPERVVNVAERIKSRYKLREMDLDALKRDKAQIRSFFEIYNASFSRTVHNFIPFTEEEMKEEAAQTIPLLDSSLCSFLADEKGEVAGFAVNFPSISEGLKKAHGRLFPFGWRHLLKAMRGRETVDMMLNGAAPQWQNTGVSAVYHTIVFDKFRRAGVKWGITNPQIEDNPAAKVWETYQHEPFMRRRCYIKKIK